MNIIKGIKPIFLWVTKNLSPNIVPWLGLRPNIVWSITCLLCGNVECFMWDLLNVSRHESNEVNYHKQLEELHVYLVPLDCWQQGRNLATKTIENETISLGFVRWAKVTCYISFVKFYIYALIFQSDTRTEHIQSSTWDRDPVGSSRHPSSWELHLYPKRWPALRYGKNGMQSWIFLPRELYCWNHKNHCISKRKIPNKSSSCNVRLLPIESIVSIVG